MDDFRVGSIPSSDPYGNRRPSDAAARQRRKRHDDEEPADNFAAQPPEVDDTAIEDYYTPSDPDSNS